MLNAPPVCSSLLHNNFGIKTHSSGPVSTWPRSHDSFEVAVNSLRLSSQQLSRCLLLHIVSLPWFTKGGVTLSPLEAALKVRDAGSREVRL